MARFIYACRSIQTLKPNERGTAILSQAGRERMITELQEFPTFLSAMIHVLQNG